MIASLGFLEFTIGLIFLVGSLFYAFHILKNDVSNSIIIPTMFLCCFGTFLLTDVLKDIKPSAIDVYRDKTTLQITSVNGVPTDSVVVYKKK